MTELSPLPQLLYWRRWRHWLALLLLVCGAVAPLAGATPLARQVKAAYLIKFAGFVEWPAASFARPDSALEIGVAGSDALVGELAAMAAGRSVNGRAFRVRRIEPGAALAGLHILFIDPSLAPAGAADLLAAAHGHALLTVSDAASDPGEPGAASMIQFVVTGDRLRFDVALRQVADSGLRISARMLAVAHRVRGAT